MADNFDNYSMKVQATAVMPKVGDINKQIEKLEQSIKKLKISGKLDDSSLKNLTHQLDTLKATVTTANFSPTALTELTNQVNKALQNINIGNINLGNTGNQSQQVGQQIGNNIAQGVKQGVEKATSTVKSFEQLTDSMQSQKIIFNDEGLKDTKATLDAIKNTYAEFGQVKITNQVFNGDELKSFKVNIEQVNGELKETRSFMMSLSDNKLSFILPDDVIKGTEKYVQHLNAAKNITNATGDALNEQKQKLAEQEKYYDKLEKASKEQLSIEQKRITAGEKQLKVLDAQNKRRNTRIAYNEGQIEKKGLTDNSRKREINDLKYAGNEKYDELWAKEIDKNIKNISKLKDKWEEQGVYVDEFRLKVEQLEQSLNDINSGDVKGLNSIRQQIDNLKSEASTIVEANKIQLSLDDGTYESKYDSLISKTRQWVDVNDESVISTQKLTVAYNEFNKAATEFIKDGSIENRQRLIDAQEELGRQLKSTTNDIRTQNAEWAKTSKVDSLHQKIQEFYDKNTATHRQWGVQLKNMLDETAHGAQVTAKRINEIEQEYLGVVNAARQAGKLGLSFFDSVKEQGKKFIQWFSITDVIMETIETIKKMASAVYEIDTAMTNLYKVTDETSQRYDRFLDSATDKAQELGRTVSSLVEQTANWSKLGFSLDEAEKLAEISSIYANVGEVDDDTAVSDMVTAMKAFNIEASDAITIVDMLNTLGNKYATSAADLGAGLSRSASAMATAGTDIEKTLAMLTGGAEITQSADEFGNMLKVGSMRIRGMKGELEALGEEVDENVESISKMQTQILNLTHGKVNIFNDNGEFKDYYDIMEGVAKIYSDLSSTEQASLSEILFGKQRGNQGAALIQAFQSGQIQKAYADIQGSAGSAYEEQARWMESLEAKTAQFEAAFQSLSNTILDSDLLKWFVDFGTGSVNALDWVIDKLGTLSTIGILGGGILGAKGHGLTNCVTIS